MNYQHLLNLGIIIGGKSVEHEISLISGLQAILNLDKKKYNIYIIYLTKNNNLITSKKLNNLKAYNKTLTHKKTNCILYKENNATILKTKFKKTTLDCIIPIIHGKGVEDGNVAGYLNLLGIPYTSSNVLASSIAQDKCISKRILKTFNIPVLPSCEIKDEIDFKKLNKFIQKHHFPLILKPSRLGSSIGIEVAHNQEELLSKINKCKKYETKILIEPKLKKYTEYNIACYTISKKLITSQIEEVSSTNEILSFNDKYDDGGLKQTDKSTRIIPAKINEALEEQIISYTKTIYQELEFKGVIRIDFIYDLEKEMLYVNEINTIPGSLAFYLYEGLGIKYPHLLDDLVKQALIDSKIEERLLTSFDNYILNLNKIKPKK